MNTPRTSVYKSLRRGLLLAAAVIGLSQLIGPVLTCGLLGLGFVLLALLGAALRPMLSLDTDSLVPSQTRRDQADVPGDRRAPTHALLSVTWRRPRGATLPAAPASLSSPLRTWYRGAIPGGRSMSTKLSTTLSTGPRNRSRPPRTAP